MPDYVSSECLDKLINGDPFQKATWGMLCCVWQVSYTCSIKPLLLWHLNPHTHKSLIFPNYPIKGLTRLCTWSLRGKFLSLCSKCSLNTFFYSQATPHTAHPAQPPPGSRPWLSGGLAAAHQHEHRQVAHLKAGVALWSSNFILPALEVAEGSPACQKQDFGKSSGTVTFRQEGMGSDGRLGDQRGGKRPEPTWARRDFGAVRHFPYLVRH